MAVANSGTAKVTLPSRRGDPHHARVRRTARSRAAPGREPAVPRALVGRCNAAQMKPPSRSTCGSAGPLALRDGRAVATRSPSTASSARSCRSERIVTTEVFEGAPPSRRGRRAQRRHVHGGRRPHDARAARAAPEPRRSATRSWTPGWRPGMQEQYDALDAAGQLAVAWSEALIDGTREGTVRGPPPEARAYRLWGFNGAVRQCLRRSAGVLDVTRRAVLA